MLSFERIVVMATLFTLFVNTAFLGYVLWAVRQAKKEYKRVGK